MEIAASNPLAAAFALDSSDERGGQGMACLGGAHPEAIYWALRVWTKHQHQASEFPYWLEYQTVIKRMSAGFTIGAADIDQTEARNAVRGIGPNPWAVEMIVDLKLESDLVRELCQASFKNIDNDDRGPAPSFCGRPNLSRRKERTKMKRPKTTDEYLIEPGIDGLAPRNRISPRISLPRIARRRTARFGQDAMRAHAARQGILRTTGE